jgi:hypothetical protein
VWCLKNNELISLYFSGQTADVGPNKPIDLSTREVVG